jgi:hypothetical protein
MQADDLDVESLIAQWRLQAAAADVRGLSVRDEILLLAGSALACCSVASAVLGYFAVMVIAGVLFAGITIYIRRFAKSVLVVGPGAPVTRLPLWAVQFIDVPSRARLVRLVNTRRI